MADATRHCCAVTVASDWVRRAGELARWAWERLVNRADCYGGYRPPEEWGRAFQRRDGTRGKLGPQTTHKRPLTLARLCRHFHAAGRADLLGLHTTSRDNTSKWGGPEIDWHGPQSTAPSVNLAVALAWYAKLVGLGFRPLLTDSNGAGGYHGPLVLFNQPVPTPLVFAFVGWLVADHARHGLPQPPEIFPKQQQLQPGRYGNWLRLPGQHHTRPHWSRAWNGRSWLEGAAAIDFILSLQGDAPSLIPDGLLSVPTPAPAQQPPCTLSVRRGGGGLARRIAGYMARLPHLAEGQGRDDVAYHFAAFLTRDLALPGDLALVWLERWDNGNCPPKGRMRLQEIIANAGKYAKRPLGCGRDDRTLIAEI